jgi:hypothetical protein
MTLPISEPQWDIWWSATTAIATLLAALISVIALIFAGAQVRILNRTNQFQHDREVKWRSLDVVNTYVIDPVLAHAKKELYIGTKGLSDYSIVTAGSELRFHVRTVLNFLESFSTGIEQGLYNEVLLRDYFKNLLIRATRVYILGSFPDNPTLCVAAKFDKENFPSLIRIYNRWSAVDVEHRDRETAAGT